MKKPAYIAAAIVVATLCTLSLPVQTFAQSTWVGGAGSWGTGANWCPTGVPNGVDVVVGNCQNSNPSTVTVDSSNTSNNLTIAGGNTVSISATRRLTVNGPSISNAGTLNLAGSGAQGAQLVLGAPTSTLSGSGTLLLSDAANIVFSGTSTNFINQQTIRGAGAFGSAGNMNINNQALFDAQGTNPLSIQPTLGMRNSGTLQASNGGTLQIQIGGNPATLDNTSGTIKALTGSLVLLKQGTISGGTLTTVGTGLVRVQGGGISALTNSGVFQVGGVSGGSASLRMSGTIQNSGTIRLGSSAWGDDVTIVDGTVTLTGGGTFTFDNSIERLVSGSGTPILVNSNNTINGTGTILGNPLSLSNSGTVDANRSTPLVIQANTTNTGTMQASNGGDLRLTQATVNNTGGTLKALDGSTVTLAGGSITGGTFTSSGSGVVRTTANNPTVDSVSNTGTFLIPDNGQVMLLNTIANSGVISLNSTGGPVSFRIGNAVTFTGHGAILMSDSPNNIMAAQNGGSKITNFDNLIAGAGQIGVPLVNQKKGVVLANLTNILKLNSSVNNLGKFQVNPGSVLQIPGNSFSNFANNTLTGGTYVVGGTFAFNSANIITNAANIQLTSPTAQIVNINSNANALANLATNTKKGQFTVTGKAALTTIPSFTTQGKVTVGAKSNFTVGGSYTQTLGSTKVDGTLTIPTGYFLQGGGLFGKGKVVAVVTSGAAVTAGDTVNAAGTLTIDGTYTQQNAGSLNIQIGGTTPGSKYSQLVVTNGVSLDGTLNLKLIKNFLPAIGDTFTILTASARSGQFATVNGLSINSGEHFQITYASNSVQLQVVSGP